MSLPPPSSPTGSPAEPAPADAAGAARDVRSARWVRRAAGVLRWSAWAVFASVVLLGLSWLTLRYYVWPNLDRWRPAIESRLAEAVGRPVKLGPLATGFEGLRPLLIAREVSIDDEDGQQAFAAAEIRALLSLRSLATGRPALALLEIDSPSLRIERVAARRLRVAGVDIDLDASAGGEWLDRLFAQRRIVLRHAQVQWHDRLSGESGSLADIDLVLGSAGRRHRVSLQAPALAELGSGVDLAVEFRRPPFSRAGDWRKWKGEVRVGAARLDLAALARRGQQWDATAAPSMTVRAGQARLRGWSHFENAALVDGMLEFAADGVDAELDGRPLPLRALTAEAHARRQADGSTLVALPVLRVSDAEGWSLTASPEGSKLVLSPRGAPAAARLTLDRFDAAEVARLLGRLPLPEALGAGFASMKLDGIVERLAIDWSADERADATGSAPSHFGIEMAFERLGFQRIEAPPRPGELKLPGFANVSGNARITERGGRVSLHGESVVLRFPGLFAEPEVPLDRLEAQASWTLAPPPTEGAAPVVDLAIESFHFANADASGEVSGHYRSGGKGAGLVDLRGSLQRADAARTARYLPLEIPEEVRHWVRDAVLAGRSNDARFVLKGDLEDFPYREPATGEFRVEASLADATLAYAPGWPAIERIQGRLRFERAGMEIEMRSGRVWDVALAQTRARIAEFREPLLRIEGSGQGPAQDMVRFVNESPLLARIDDFTRDVAIDGGATLRLAFEMPLEDIDATRVRGSVQLPGNDLVLDRTLPRFERVAGRLEFTEDRLSLRSMTATLLGGPISVEGDTPEPGRFQLRARGTMPAEGIVRLADNVLTRHLAGSAQYSAEVDVRRRAATLIVDSDLEGLASTLPAPFGKAADARWPLRIESRPVPPPGPAERPVRDTLMVSLRDDVRLVFERERDPGSEQLRVRRGAFAVADAPTLPDAGFAVLLRTAAVDLDAWNALLGDELLDGARAGAPEGFSLMPDTVSLVAGTVEVAGKALHDVVLGASRADGSWRANIHAREIDGYFSWRKPRPGEAHGTLTARFARLEIPRDRIDDFEALLETPPQSLPALDVTAEQLILNDRRLGALDLAAVNTGSAAAPVWQLQRLRIRNPAATLNASGSWQTRPGVLRRATALDFDLQIADAGALLGLFGFPQTVRGGSGTLGGQVRWIGSPMRLDYHSLGGELSIDLGKGQFLKSDPGIAKLIGVVNLQSLRRRLAFDFRDVFAEGFAFDRITGNARIEGGIVRTDDFAMRGVAAQVGIRGQTDIAAETQTLVVEVRPELNAALASLAYGALVNPAVGLGSLVAQLALRTPLQQIFAYEYDVTGPWSDPQVTARSRGPAAAPVPALP
ncbi:MAG: TIGR02099 family protein [Lautropia sp. SCN 69-89]|nr:MAG: TIGR02099 family protein [Lautropia sp. SCN 69-89]